MFQLSDKYYELLDHYEFMAINGYKRNDGIFVDLSYNDIP